MQRLAALCLLALAACATPRTQEKISFEELFAAPAQAPEPVPAPSSARGKKWALAAPGQELPTAQASPQLQAALASFVNQARAHRRQVRRGSPMPAAQVDNWRKVAGALEAFLARSPESTAALDLVRARVTVEAELEEDARAYGDIPAELAEAVMGQVGRLAARMSLVRGLQVRSSREAPRFTWPLSPVSVTSHFGSREHPILGEVRGHLGVDLAARRGQVVRAAAPGVVLSAGWNGSHGYQVEVQHAARTFTRYSHLSQVLVEPGQLLERGDALGLAGDTGLATGVHLHFELWKDGQPRDPLDELGDDVEQDEGSVSLELAPVSSM